QRAKGGAERRRRSRPERSEARKHATAKPGRQQHAECGLNGLGCPWKRRWRSGREKEVRSFRLSRGHLWGRGGRYGGRHGLAGFQDFSDIFIAPDLLTHTLERTGFQRERFGSGLGVGLRLQVGLLLWRQRFPIGGDGLPFGALAGIGFLLAAAL